MHRLVKCLCFFFMLTSYLIHAQECLYNETMCACAFGSSEGACYERNDVVSTPELCNRRTCDAGWMCDCEGDYFCDQADIDVYTLIDFNDFEMTENVPCQLTSQRTITSSGFQLGYFHPQFSDNGLLDQQCQVFAWWLDGVLQNSFESPTTVTASNLETVKTSLSDWNNLPLRRGSVIGFRWKDAPYSCYRGVSDLNVNGTIFFSNESTLVSHRFSYNFENDWFSTDFVENSNWNDPLTTDTSDLYGLENTEITNVYWRIKVLS